MSLRKMHSHIWVVSTHVMTSLFATLFLFIFIFFVLIFLFSIFKFYLLDEKNIICFFLYLHIGWILATYFGTKYSLFHLSLRKFIIDRTFKYIKLTIVFFTIGNILIIIFIFLYFLSSFYQFIGVPSKTTFYLLVMSHVFIVFFSSFVFSKLTQKGFSDLETFKNK